MGLFKKLFGDAIDEMKKNLENSKEEILDNVNEIKENVYEKMSAFASTLTETGSIIGIAGKAKEKNQYNAVLTEAGKNMLQVVKVVMDTCGLNLKEAKDLVNDTPATIKEGLSKEEAENIQNLFKMAGAKVELKEETLDSLTQKAPSSKPLQEKPKQRQETQKAPSSNPVQEKPKQRQETQKAPSSKSALDQPQQRETTQKEHKRKGYSPEVDEYVSAKRRAWLDADKRKNDSPQAALQYRDIADEFREIIKAISRGASTVEEIESELEKVLGNRKSELEQVADSLAENKKGKLEGEVFSTRFEALISAALQDGVLTDQEKAILKKRAEAEGEDWGEVEMIINSRLTGQKAVSPTNASTAPVASKDVNMAKKTAKVRPSIIHKPLPKVKKYFIVRSGTEKIEEDYYLWDDDDYDGVLLPSSLLEINLYRIGKSVRVIDFSNCHHLKKIYGPAMCQLPNLEILDLSKCTNLEEIGDRTFENCKKLEAVYLPPSIRRIGVWSFSGCENLKEVDFSLCTNLERIEDDAFLSCNLVDVDLSNCISLNFVHPDAFRCNRSVRRIDFSGCKDLSLNPMNIRADCELILPSGQKSFNVMFIGKQFGVYNNVDVSNCNDVKEMINEIFYYENIRDEIKEIIIPDTVEVIHCDERASFDRCSNLKTIVMPAALKELKGSLVSYCDQLKKIDFSKVKNLKTIQKGVFSWGCKKLKELIIPEGVIEIEDDAFSETHLKRLFLPPTLRTIGDLGLKRLSIYCFSPSLEELEPIVYGWDDDDDDDDDEILKALADEKKGVMIMLYVLPQYLDKYISQRNAERIPEKVLSIQEIPEEYRYYYDN